ncbi:MAG: DUF4199 domain-containing protein [Lewinellaceae bacterium]|nr:DUF4199 domain-containing protein [Saprospiraceae bacterium]MCB9333753.1 DUF4199 domain-containing protein [Lewinellaceae bacterium]
MQKTILKYGLISGGITAALMLCSALFLWNDPGNFENSEIFGYASILLSMLFVFLGVRAYRDQVADGLISFGKAFQVGLLICLISCAIYVITWMIIYHTMFPDFMDQFVDYSLKKLRESGATAEEITKQTEQFEYYKELYKNPLVAAGITFLEPLPVGLVVTLASAGILRRQA